VRGEDIEADSGDNDIFLYEKEWSSLFELIASY